MRRSLIALAFTVLMAPLFTLPSTAAAPAPAYSSTCPTLRYGSTGSAVSTLQSKLRGLGYHITVDGKFFRQTRSVVMAFQKSHGLHVDGWVGRQTNRALGCTAAASAPTSIFHGRSPSGSVYEVSAEPAVNAHYGAFLQSGWPVELWPKVSCIINLESRGDANSTNGQLGLLQIQSGALGYVLQVGGTKIEDLFDPRINMAVGYLMYRAHGWGPWNGTQEAC